MASYANTSGEQWAKALAPFNDPSRITEARQRLGLSEQERPYLGLLAAANRDKDPDSFSAREVDYAVELARRAKLDNDPNFKDEDLNQVRSVAQKLSSTGAKGFFKPGEQEVREGVFRSRPSIGDYKYEDFAGLTGSSMMSVPGTLVSQGTSGLTDLVNKYKDNEALAGLGVGTLADIFKTQANTGLAVQYNDAFLGSLGNYQKGIEELKTGNTKQLMAAEGAIQRGLLQTQGDYAIRGKELDVGRDRYVADRGYDATRYTADTQLGQTKVQADAQKYGAELGLKGIESQTGAQRYGAELGLRGIESQVGAQRYGAELGLKGIESQAGAQRYGAELGLKGIESQTAAQKYGFDQQLAGVGLQTGAQRYGAELGLRGIESQTAAQRYGAELGLKGIESQTDAQRYGFDRQLDAAKIQTDAQRYGFDRQLDAMRLQTDAQRYGFDRQFDTARLQTDAQRYGFDKDLEGKRYVADREVDATRLQTDTQRYGYDRQLDATRVQADAQRYGYDKDLQGKQYVADRSLEGQKYGFDSQERQIGLQGSEDRKTLSEKYNQERIMRADARGAIRSQGSRFYG